MKSENMEMEAIFKQLSERNKDVLILIARGMKVAQEAAHDPCKLPQKPKCQ